ncbi:precorrin-2/cobalt-factor-2 C20-methyltransferase [Ectothiorhodosinus mongolicus]|uniref:Precorrin-2/cobalt-factor-2 C20-methyltransferase n=1 Tax=Ectothiorhodosinus mongolicus TaxID=233100 RepID=A0A1R3VWF5_9GAMM|nr:precorrin-2 C(20)-methyltransferase [Ectothiorhodosinus mongolicus]ULX57004.1 precorrin-2 C(20)-methyltransferase [Ectothiorhodosinus mongolicus]SIT69416.1 precorrin-2/cobalt-factor-2 C20-methyltransferase [Ectothiorhodosinus mongolicus]
MAIGRLLGIGLGPGDPELLSLKALRLLQSAPVVAYFVKPGREGQARRIAAPHLLPRQKELRLEYPFTTEVSLSDSRYHEQMHQFYDDSAVRIAALLDAGQDVAVICEGDPFFYGSYMYLHDRLAEHYDTEVVPAVTGMSACWTAANTPITHGDDVLTVLPGTLPASEMQARIPSSDALVFMKVGRQLPKIRAALQQAGRLQRAYLVEGGSMPEQRVRRLADVPEEEIPPYFSIVLVPGRLGQR